jgi:hypothetical protein
MQNRKTFYREKFLDENPYLKNVPNSKILIEFRNNLIFTIVKNKQSDVNFKFLLLNGPSKLNSDEEIGSSDLDSDSLKTKSSSGYFYTSSSSSSSYAYSVHDFEQNLNDSQEISERDTRRSSVETLGPNFSPQEKLAYINDIINVFNTCDSLKDMNSILDLYGTFCANLELVHKSQFIPDGRHFLEWFLIKQITMNKILERKKTKKSIYSF